MKTTKKKKLKEQYWAIRIESILYGDHRTFSIRPMLFLSKKDAASYKLLKLNYPFCRIVKVEVREI